MKLVKLTKDVPHEGLSAGTVLNVDERSAANMVKAGEAEDFDPNKDDADAERVETIDDIPSTAPGHRQVTSARTVGYADDGPVLADVSAEGVADPALSAKVPAKAVPAAPGAKPAGGDPGDGAAKK